MTIKLDPACFKGFPLAITNQGYLLPCCYCDDPWTLNNEEFQKLYRVSKISDHNTINDIIYSKEWKRFFKNLKKHKGPPACMNTCRKNTEVRKDVSINTSSNEIETIKIR